MKNFPWVVVTILVCALTASIVTSNDRHRQIEGQRSRIEFLTQHILQLNEEQRALTNAPERASAPAEVDWHLLALTISQPYVIHWTNGVGRMEPVWGERYPTILRNDGVVVWRAR